jgi:hypothetical protein
MFFNKTVKNMKNNQKPSDQIESLKNFKLLFNNGCDLLGSRQYANISKALDSFFKALDICNKLYHNHNHYNTAKALYNVGYSYQQLEGETNCLKALDFQKQALDMRQAYYGNVAHPEIAKSLNSIGAIYAALPGIDNKKKSLQFSEEALVMRQKLYKDQPDASMLESLFSVAMSYIDLGGEINQDQGLRILEQQALPMAKSLYGMKPHFDTAKILNSIGLIYQESDSIENINKALALIQESLNIRQKLYSKMHQDIATTLGNIGGVYQKLSTVDINNCQEHLNNALDYTKQAVEMNSQLYIDIPHPALAKSFQDLGIVYIHIGGHDNMEQAYNLQQQALQMYQKLYSHDHPCIVECLDNIEYIIDNSEIGQVADNNDIYNNTEVIITADDSIELNESIVSISTNEQTENYNLCDNDCNDVTLTGDL